MPAGRPSAYQPQFIETAKAYIASCGREATELPTIEGLSLAIGVDDTTLLAWADAKNEDGSLKNPEFLATIKDLKSAQKAQLVNDGLYGGKEVNSSMAIFLLKANHNMVETERRMLVGEKGAEPVQIVSYGNTDPLSVYASSSNAAGPRRSAPISGAELASEST